MVVEKEVQDGVGKSYQGGIKMVKEALRKIELGGGFRDKQTLRDFMSLMEFGEIVELVWKLQHALQCEKAAREREYYAFHR